MLNRRSFLARLFAAPVVALAVLRAPVVEEPDPFCVPFEWDSAFPPRMDILYGYATMRPEFAVRIEA